MGVEPSDFMAPEHATGPPPVSTKLNEYSFSKRYIRRAGFVVDFAEI
jgi:hypothetical protein